MKANLVNPHDGEIAEYHIETQVSAIDGQNIVRAWRPAELTTKGVPDKRHHGRRVGTYKSRHNDGTACYHFTLSLVPVFPAVEAKAQPIRDRIKAIEAQLNAAKLELAKVYHDNLSQEIVGKLF